MDKEANANLGCSNKTCQKKMYIFLNVCIYIICLVNLSFKHYYKCCNAPWKLGEFEHFGLPTTDQRAVWGLKVLVLG